MRCPSSFQDSVPPKFFRDSVLFKFFGTPCPSSSCRLQTDSSPHPFFSLPVHHRCVVVALPVRHCCIYSALLVCCCCVIGRSSVRSHCHCCAYGSQSPQSVWAHRALQADDTFWEDEAFSADGAFSVDCAFSVPHAPGRGGNNSR